MPVRRRSAGHHHRGSCCNDFLAPLLCIVCLVFVGVVLTCFGRVKESLGHKTLHYKSSPLKDNPLKRPLHGHSVYTSAGRPLTNFYDHPPRECWRKEPHERHVSVEFMTDYHHHAAATPSKVNVLFVAFGQFLDHFISASENDPSATETHYLEPHFGDGNIHLVGVKRTHKDPSTKMPINIITPLVDGSAIYGHDEDRHDKLREYRGGRMKLDHQGFPPLNVYGLHNEPSSYIRDIFLLGDFRGNENSALLSMHILFLREHNYWADKYQETYPTCDDQEIFEMARRQTVLHLQYIVWEEFLPALVGNVTHQRPYEGDNYPVKMFKEFTTAAFRFGHTLIPPTFHFADTASATHEVLYEKSITEIFHQKATFLKDLGGSGAVDSLLWGMMHQHTSPFDAKIIHELTNHTMENGDVFDLASFNLFRGREHDQNSYVVLRHLAGLPPVTSWADITSSHEKQEKLEKIYGCRGWETCQDLWVLLMSEDPLVEEGSLVGPTARHIILKQFGELQAGDPYFYQWEASIRSILKYQGGLCEVLKRNTCIEHLQCNGKTNIFHRHQ